MEVTPLPAFDDNYIWMLGVKGSDHFVAVDPGDETPVLDWLDQQGGVLSAIMLTHQHYDHIGGVLDLLQAYPATPVYGPAKHRIQGLDHPVKEGDKPELPGLSLNFSVMDLPGHTAGHIAYYGEGVLFCGDTLFAGGCGRIFDGTHEQLAESLQRIAQLPTKTLIYCAHEYTLANLGFAAWVEPENPNLAQRQLVERQKRDAGKPTLPTSLELELATNPFLRTDQPQVIEAAQRYAGRPLVDHTQVFTTLRNWKDREYD